MWRRLLILLAALAGALAGAALALRSERVANNLRQRIEALAAERLGLKLEIASLHIGLWPPRLRFEDVRVTLAGGARPALAVQRGAVSVHPWPSPTGAVIVDVLELDGVHADVDVEALRRSMSASRRESRSPVDIETLRVTDADLHVAGREWRADVGRADLAMRPAGAGRREVEVELEDATLERRGERTPVEASVRAVLRGGLDRPLAVELTSARVGFDRMQLLAKGGIGLEGPTTIDLELESALELARARELWPDLPPLGGAAQVTVRATGSPLSPELSARAAVRGLAVGGAGLGDLELEGRIDRQLVHVDSFKLSHPTAGKLTGSAVVELTKGTPVSGAVRLHDVSFPVVLELSGLPEPWVDGVVSGDVGFRGRLSPFGLAADTTLTLTGFRVLDRSFRAPDGVEYLRPEAMRVEGRVSIGATAVGIDDVTVTRGGSELKVQGALHYDPQRGLDLHAAGDDVALEEVGPIALVEFGGHGAIAAVVEGPYRNPTISGTITADGLSAAGYFVGDTRATLIYSDLVLRVDRASGRRGGGTFAGGGHIDFHDSTLATEAHAVLEGVGLQDLLASFSLPWEVRSRLEAKASGDVQLSGPLLSPTVRSKLEAPSLAVDATDLGPLTLRADWDGDAGRGSLALEAGSKSGAVRAGAAFERGGVLSVDAEFRDLSLAAFASLMGDIDIDGRATGLVHLEGPAEALAGRVEATSPDLVTYATHLGHTALTGEVEGGDMRIAGTTADGRATVQGRVQLSRKMGYNLTAHFTDLKIASLWPGLGSLDASTTGSLFSQGLLTSPDSMLADIVIEQGQAALLGTTLQPARPIRLQYADRALHVVDFALGGSGASATLTGKLGTDGRLELALAASVTLDAARPTIWHLAASGGRVELGLQISGTWGAPVLSGEGSLENGVFRLSDTGQLVDGARGRVVFAGRSISIESLSARTGGGSVTIAGTIALPPGKEPELDLRADIDDVSLRPTPQLSLAGRGDLRLLGERKDLALTGDLEILSLRYTANLDLEKLIPRRNVPPLRVPALDAGSAVRLGVHVSAADNVVVTSPVLETELHADVVVTGTTERMGLVGSLTPLWARARYQENTFDVERASILFTDEYRIFTQYDLRARTQACNMRITVDIQGTSDGYNVVPSGTDEVGPVSPQDILACLQLGIRLRDLRGPEGNLLSDRLTSSSLDALWAVSGLDQQVRRILPIVDELRVSSGWSQRGKRTTTRIVVGKEVGQNLQLTYSRALDVEYDQIFSVAYKMSDLATMLGTWNTGTDAQGGDFGIDLRLRWEFQ